MRSHLNNECKEIILQTFIRSFIRAQINKLSGSELQLFLLAPWGVQSFPKRPDESYKCIMLPITPNPIVNSILQWHPKHIWSAIIEDMLLTSSSARNAERDNRGCEHTHQYQNGPSLKSLTCYHNDWHKPTYNNNRNAAGLAPESTNINKLFAAFALLCFRPLCKSYKQGNVNRFECWFVCWFLGWYSGWLLER